MYDAHLTDSLKVATDDEQRDEKLALLLLALSLTVYAWDLSKLDALTVNLSLPPAVMERDKPDIDTLGGRGVRVAVAVGVGVRVAVAVGVTGVAVGAGRIVTVWLLVATTPDLPDRYSRAVTVTLPASQA